MLAKTIAPLLLALTAVGCAGASGEETGSSEDKLAEIGADPVGTPSKHPIVLAHGFNASDTNIWSFNGVAEALTKDGNTVHAARVAPIQSVAARAAELATHIDQARAECQAKPGCDASKVHLVAHSMGGLDARYVVAKLSNPDGVPYSKIVVSVTTISSPHHGTAVGDKLTSLLPNVADPLVNALSGLWARTFTDRDLAEGSDLRAALHDLSEGYSPAFNADVPNAPGVYYQSWAGVSSYASLYISDAAKAACENKVESYQDRADRLYDHNPLASGQLELLMPITGHGVGDDAIPNDSMVTVASAKWGTFRGCFPADHMDEVGQRIGSDGPALWSRFDHVRFYRRLAFELDTVSHAK